MKVFGSDNVMIVDSADMKSRQQETMEVRPGLNFPRALACVEPQPYLPCTDTQRWGFPFLARVVSRLLLFLTVWRTRETSPSHPSRELCLSSDKSSAIRDYTCLRERRAALCSFLAALVFAMPPPHTALFVGVRVVCATISVPGTSVQCFRSHVATWPCEHIVLAVLVVYEQKVYRFLGLCPADGTKLEPENVTKPPDIPGRMIIDAATFKVQKLNLTYVQIRLFAGRGGGKS